MGRPGKVSLKDTKLSAEAVDLQIAVHAYNFDVNVASLKDEHVKFIKEQVVPALNDNPHASIVLLGTARFARALIQTWKSPAQSVTIAVRTSRAPALWQGTSFGLSDVLVSGHGTAIELASQPGFGFAIASFPDQEFQRVADIHGCGSIIDNTKSILFRLPKADAAHAIRTAIRSS